jgi:16S rRNA processing protein RimM
VTKRPHLSARQPPDHVVVGRIVRPHGIRGDVLAEITPRLEGLLQAEATVFVGDSLEPTRIRSVRKHQHRHLLSLSGVTGREQAERLRDMALRVRVDDVDPLPPHVFYHWQILGMDVISEGGERLGRIDEIIETGANDVYVVRDEGGAGVLLPAIESVILDVDLSGNRMTVHLLPGLRSDSP